MPPVKEETFLTKSIEFLPLITGLTAVSSPAGMSVYWLSNSLLTFGQSVYVREKLKAEGLDIKKMQLENIAAREDPYANQIKVLKDEGLITDE